MEREIKFRVWDKGQNKMKLVTCLQYINGQMDCVVADRTDIIEDIEKLVLMQYTCQKDADGREIFEYDILQPKIHENKIYVVVWDKGAFKMQYKFLETYKNKKYEKVRNLPLNAEFYRVIGNVYQNPELLEYHQIY